MSRSFQAFTLALCLAGCSSPADNAPRAQVSSTQAAVAPAAARGNAAEAVTYRFDGNGSKIEFVGAKVTATHEGAFTTFTGTVQVIGNDLTSAIIATEIDVASITVEPARLNNHLKSPDLLDVAQFPKARFTSTSIRVGGEGGATHTVTGTFELHGQTKTITFPATLRTSASGVEADAQFAINRRDFGIIYPGMPDDLIKDEVLIKLTIRGVR